MVSRHSTRLGGPPPHPGTGSGPTEPPSVFHEPAYQSLRRAHRGFGARATAAAVGGFLLYVLLSGFAPGLMNIPLSGHLTIGLTLGVGQFVLMAVIVWRYLRHMRTRVTPLVRGLRGLARRQEEKAARARAAARPAAPRTGEFRPW